MSCKNIYAIASFCLLFFSCESSRKSITSNNNILPATELQPYGRYLIDKQQNLELISSAAHFRFSFTGKECTMYASINNVQGHNYLQYELDGVYQKRLKIMGGPVQEIVLSANNDGGTHDLDL